MTNTTSPVRKGLDAFTKDTFDEEARQDYIDALTHVRETLSKLIADEDLKEFLDGVLDAELQGAPHIIVDGAGPEHHVLAMHCAPIGDELTINAEHRALMVTQIAAQGGDPQDIAASVHAHRDGQHWLVATSTLFTHAD